VGLKVNGQLSLASSIPSPSVSIVIIDDEFAGSFTPDVRVCETTPVEIRRFAKRNTGIEMKFREEVFIFMIQLVKVNAVNIDELMQ
jgi:hypothetical protein